MQLTISILAKIINIQEDLVAYIIRAITYYSVLIGRQIVAVMNHLIRLQVSVNFLENGMPRPPKY